MLAELVDLVIGVDTHTDTHTAAVVTAATGAIVTTVTVPADAEGYAELVELADGQRIGLLVVDRTLPPRSGYAAVGDTR